MKVLYAFFLKGFSDSCFIYGSLCFSCLFSLRLLFLLVEANARFIKHRSNDPMLFQFRMHFDGNPSARTFFCDWANAIHSILMTFPGKFIFPTMHWASDRLNKNLTIPNTIQFDFLFYAEHCSERTINLISCSALQSINFTMHTIRILLEWQIAYLVSPDCHKHVSDVNEPTSGFHTYYYRLGPAQNERLQWATVIHIPGKRGRRKRTD